MGLNRAWWNMGSNLGYCYEAECGYGQHGPLEPQESTMRSRISPSQDKGADLDTLLVPLRKGVAEADTLRRHLRWPRCYLLVPFVPRYEFLDRGLSNNVV